MCSVHPSSLGVRRAGDSPPVTAAHAALAVLTAPCSQVCPLSHIPALLGRPCGLNWPVPPPPHPLGPGAHFCYPLHSPQLMWRGLSSHRAEHLSQQRTCWMCLQGFLIKQWHLKTLPTSHPTLCSTVWQHAPQPARSLTSSSPAPSWPPLSRNFLKPSSVRSPL